MQYKAPLGGQYQAPHQQARMAQIVSVDSEKGTVEVVHVDGMGRRADIPIKFPFLSQNAWIRTMPEIGSFVWIMYSEYGDGQIIGYHWPKYEDVTRKAGLENERGTYLFKPLVEREIELGNNDYGYIGITKEGRVYQQSGTVFQELIRDDQEHLSYAARFTRRLPNNMFMEEVERGVEHFGEVRRVAQKETGTNGDSNIVYHTKGKPDPLLKPLYEQYVQLRWDPEVGEGPELFQMQNGHVVNDDAEYEYDPFYKGAAAHLRKKEIWYTRDNTDEIIITYNDLHGNVTRDIPGQQREFIGLPRNKGSITKSDDVGSEFRSLLQSLAGGRKMMIGVSPSKAPLKSFIQKNVSLSGKFGKDNVPYTGPLNYGPIGGIGLPTSVYSPSKLNGSETNITGDTVGGGETSSGTTDSGGVAQETQTSFNDERSGLSCLEMQMAGLDYGATDLNTGARAKRINFGEIAADTGKKFLLGEGGLSYDSTNRYSDMNVFPAPPNLSSLSTTLMNLMAWPYISSGPANTTPMIEPDSDYRVCNGNAEYVYAKDTQDGKSLFINTEGSMIQSLGRDNMGRSFCSSYLGGIELSVGPNNFGQAYGMVCNGDYNLRVNGNYQELIVGRKTSIVLLNRDSITGQLDNRFASAILEIAGSVTHLPACMPCSIG